MGVHISTGVRGGFVFIVVYFHNSLGAKGLNLDLLQRLGVAVRALRLPWVIAADWQFEPGVLRASGWLDM
eukprot:5307500-Prorocentrum_lima.AAC.1